MPDVSIRESHERIISALEFNGIKFPRNHIVVNMAPADIRKEGTVYDLHLAIWILAGAEKIKADNCLMRVVFVWDTSNLQEVFYQLLLGLRNRNLKELFYQKQMRRKLQWFLIW